MRILEKRALSDHILFPGDVFFPNYLILGDRIALVDAGIVQNGPAVLRGFRERFGPDRAIDWNLLTHSHYDHLGGTPFLKRAFPDMATAGSPVIEEVLSNPRAVALIRNLSGDPGDLTDRETGHRLSFDPFRLDRQVVDGDRIDLGKGVRVTVIETPGHTRCSVAYLVEPDRALFLGEAGGVPDAGGRIQSEFLSDYPAYLESLERMAACDPLFLCLPHGGVLTEGDAAGYFRRSKEAAVSFHDWAARLLDEAGGDEERVVARIKAEEYDAGRILQDETAYRVNLRAMVRAVRRLR